MNAIAIGDVVDKLTRYQPICSFQQPRIHVRGMLRAQNRWQEKSNFYDFLKQSFYSCPMVIRNAACILHVLSVSH